MVTDYDAPTRTEAATPCLICRRPQPTNTLACPICQTRMDDQLRDIVDFYALAEGELTPGSSSGNRGNERSLGIRLSALDFVAGHDVIDVLASWEADWRDTYTLTTPTHITRPAPLLARTVTFLRTWLPRACHDHPAIDDFAHELADNWATARTAARMSPRTGLGIECPGDDTRHDDGLCHARIPVDTEQSRGQVMCRRCRTIWDVPHLMHVAIATTHIWADPEAAAGYFGITTSDLTRLARRTAVTPSHGRYDMHALQTALIDQRNDGYRRLARSVASNA